MINLRRVGLVANPEKAVCRAAVQQAAAAIAASGRQVWADADTIRLGAVAAVECPDAAALARQTDLVLVFGGDGTMLRVARAVAGLPTPILGINVGGLGFLTAVPLPQLDAALQQTWAGAYTLEERPLIEASGLAHGQSLDQVALNDFVVSRGITSRMIRLEVRVDGRVLTHYRCDGLIVSSPTGSTAYSLAAGGAIVLPTADVFALTPICPHALSNRSIILPLSATICVKAVHTVASAFLNADGQIVGELDDGDEVTIRRSQSTVRLVHLKDSSFLEALRRKLHWRGTYF